MRASSSLVAFAVWSMIIAEASCRDFGSSVGGAPVGGSAQGGIGGTRSLSPSDAGAISFSAGSASGGEGGLGGASDSSGGNGGADVGATDSGSIATRGGIAGEAGSGRVGTSGWSPQELSSGSLVLWLDAAVGVSATDGTVSNWSDQSSLAHQAVSIEPSSSPTLEAQAFGKHPGIHFDGIDDKLWITDDDSLQVGLDSFALSLVLLNQTTVCCQQLIFAKELAPAPFYGLAVCVNWWVNTNETDVYPTTGEYAALLDFDPDRVSTPFSDSADYRDGKPRVLSIVRTPQELSVRVNGHVLGSVQNNGIDVSAIGQDLVLGGHPSNDQLQFKGAIAEIVYARQTTNADAIAIDQYLATKYADVLVDP